MPRLAIEALKQRAAKGQVFQKQPTHEKRTKTDATLRSSPQSPQSSHSSQSSQSSLPSISTIDEPEPEPTPDPLELIYNIRHDALRQVPRSTVLKQDLSRTPLQDLPVSSPPLLVDGRMQIVQVRKWKQKVGFFWRSCSGEKTDVHWRTVRLPWKIWMERNFGDKWTVLWIERS